MLHHKTMVPLESIALSLVPGFQNLTFDTIKKLTISLGYRPKEIRVEEHAGYFAVIITRHWYQRILWWQKKSMYKRLFQYYAARKAAGVAFDLVIR